MFAERKLGLLLLAPALLFIALGFLVPVGVLLSGAFHGESGWGFAQFLTFFDKPLHQEVFWRTFRIGLYVTAVTAILGYGVALAIVNAKDSTKGKLIATLVLPLMISPVARTYAWVVILGKTGIVNQFLDGSGIMETPARILFTETAIFIGLVQLFFPLMVLPLISSLENLPRDVVPAARMLGANWLTIFWKVILPLSKEGLVMGGTLVFVGSLTAYVTPAILGGSKVLMMETLLYQRVTVANDYAAAGVIAVILILMSILTNFLLKRLASARKGAK